MSSSPAILPPGVTFIAVIQPSLYLLIIGTVWAAALVPLLCVLLFFSNHQVRRQPIFLMNLFTLIMGIIVGAVNLHIYVADILSAPGEGFRPRTLLAYLGMILFLPLLIDCILAFRLYVVYPPRTTSNLQLAIIFIPIVLLKVARTANLIIFMVKFAAAILVPDSASAVADFQALWDHAPWTKIEWILQVVDNCYASGFFLWKIWMGHKKARASGIVHSQSPNSNTDKLKGLFYLALSTFMFPCMFGIAQIILTFHNHDFFIGAYVFVNNLYIEIVGVLLATIWATKGRSEPESYDDHSKLSSIRYRAGGDSRTVIVKPTRDGGSRSIEMEEFDDEISHNHGSQGLPKTLNLTQSMGSV
ncbi:hypothetical protein R3P38DRAFT_2563560 [Favolaschia claudopus]|uniref:Uncharacterized protein n=1 Tax=Favolaschia claudopus TaxID=2862362 RepID=A0AAW0A1T6_9AGAR